MSARESKPAVNDEWINERRKGYKNLTHTQLCWQFLRHNPAYQAAYVHSQSGLEAEEKERLAKEWHLLEFSDPENMILSFEPAWIIEKHTYIITNEHLLSYAEDFHAHAVSQGKGGAYLHFRIDTRMPVSENIELISIALKHEHQFRQDEGSKLAELENKERQKFPDYAFALEAKKFGLSHYQIACALWPKQYSPKAGDTEQKSQAKAAVSKYLKKADALVKNYYRLLLQSGEAQLGFI